MPMGLKNAPAEFQNIMNNILMPYSGFAIVYLDDVLIFSDSVEQHLKHLKIFKELIKRNGLVISAKKTILAVTKLRSLSLLHSLGDINRACGASCVFITL